MKKSTYYDCLKAIERPDKDVETKELLLDIYEESYESYGYRRITEALKRYYELNVNRKKVLRLMRELEIQGYVSKKRQKYNSYQGEVGKIAPNILNRNFKANNIKEKLVTDVTEFNIDGTKVYLSPLLDLGNTEVISYDISLSPNINMVIKMLDSGIDESYKGAIIHSDQGFQYQNKRYTSFLKFHGIIQSMSRKGNCLDNSPAENFFSLLKKEFYYRKKFTDVNQFIKELKEYIYFFNNKRITLKLKMPPVEYRQHLC